MIYSLVEKFLIHFTYLALILILCAAGLGAPIPEDIPLTLSGWVCNNPHSPLLDRDGDGKPDTFDSPQAQPRLPNIYLMVVAGMIGVLGGDTIVYFIGRRGVHGKHFVARHLRKVLNSKRRQRVESHFIKHGSLTVFVARFLPGARSIVFAMAGISRMNYARFLLIDGMAAAISVPTFIFLGWKFAAHIRKFVNEIEHIKHIVIPIAIVLLLIAGFLYYKRRQKNPLADPLAAVPQNPLAATKVPERV